MVSAGVELVEVSDGVFARLHEGLTNAGIIVGDEGVMIIDSLRVPSFARALIEDVRKITSKPIKYVIDTHSHWDHSLGNEEFPDATIIGHQNCRAEMLDIEAQELWMNKIVTSKESWSEEARTVTITPPAMTFNSKLSMYFGGRVIELRYFGRAHTSGDIFIFLPEDKLVFTGDVAQDSGVPFMMDGYMEDWVETGRLLCELPVDRFISGHGPVGGHEALVEAKDFINELVSTTKECIGNGQSNHEAVEVILKKLSNRFGHWRGFDRVEDSIEFTFRQILQNGG
ncbi:MAG: hypothetical protein CL752_04665 [Chloroflexi bacterium]|nr:hypothetical protein [Chloroflexota bacterium]